MSTTPRTDAECIQIYTEDVTGCVDAVDYVCASFARELEKELARLRAELAVAENWVEHHSKHADDLIAENVKLRAELKELSQAYELNRVSIDELDADRARAERAEAECVEQARLLGMSGEREADLLGKLERLAKDNARLDWLESPAGFDWQWNSAHSVIVRRAAIDAAMKPNNPSSRQI